MKYEIETRRNKGREGFVRIGCPMSMERGAGSMEERVKRNALAYDSNNEAMPDACDRV